MSSLSCNISVHESMSWRGGLSHLHMSIKRVARGGERLWNLLSSTKKKGKTMNSESTQSREV